MSIALGITACMRIEVMLTAIDLDDKAMLEADEVDDEVVARRLPAKMEAAFFPGPEMHPQLYFLRG